jgi:hypothetical protein
LFCQTRFDDSNINTKEAGRESTMKVKAMKD